MIQSLRQNLERLRQRYAESGLNTFLTWWWQELMDCLPEHWREFLRYEPARLLVLQAAWKIDREGAYAARVEISTIKFFVANVLQQVLDRAIQVHGALGMTDDTPLAHWYRHERAARIYDGPDEVHKWVVARQVLRDYQ